MKPFPWRAGMRCYNRDFETPCRIVAILDGEALAVHEQTDCPLGFTDDFSNFSGADLTDAATRGALLGAIMERMETMPHDDRAAFMTEHLGNQLGLWLGGWITPQAMGAALLAAWEAAP